MYKNQKLNQKTLNEEAYTTIQAEVVTFFTLQTKNRHCAIWLEEAFQWRNIARNHGNIHIILILEKPFFFLLPSNNHQGKRARGLAR